MIQSIRFRLFIFTKRIVNNYELVLKKLGIIEKTSTDKVVDDFITDLKLLVKNVETVPLTELDNE